jgi:Peptidase E
MKLYLSSYKIGNSTGELQNWIAENDNKICLIANAKDQYTDKERVWAGTMHDAEQLENVGFEVTILDLQDYFGKSEKLADFLEGFKAFYVVGGNTFVLRRAMWLSGFDAFLKSKVNDPGYLYAGYSAGICVLAPNMKGIAVMDEPEIDPYNCGEIIYDGLSFINFTPIPHYQSDHGETEAANEAVKYCEENKIVYKTLRDGDVIIQNIGG